MDDKEKRWWYERVMELQAERSRLVRALSRRVRCEALRRDGRACTSGASAERGARPVCGAHKNAPTVVWGPVLSRSWRRP